MCLEFCLPFVPDSTSRSVCFFSTPTCYSFMWLFILCIYTWFSVVVFSGSLCFLMRLLSLIFSPSQSSSHFFCLFYGLLFWFCPFGLLWSLCLNPVLTLHCFLLLVWIFPWIYAALFKDFCVCGIFGFCLCLDPLSILLVIKSNFGILPLCLGPLHLSCGQLARFVIH